MYRFHANLQSVSTDFSYETGVSTPGGLCHKADKFSVGFKAIEFERNVRSGFWVYVRSGFWVYVRSGFLLIGRSNLREMCDRAISCSPISD
ncbi:hypothetical protein [Microcoleus sp. D3_18a_C4]|uniref:hypothetical protein n=1 Tax=Microcoleus sp. D3_18a_C4 TaxID=3055332 RepID=UPI002FD37D6B